MTDSAPDTHGLQDHDRQPDTAARHGRDPDDPGTFIKHVGWAFRCLCGADFVAGYPCPVEKREKEQAGA